MQTPSNSLKNQASDSTIVTPADHPPADRAPVPEAAASSKAISPPVLAMPALPGVCPEALTVEEPLRTAPLPTTPEPRAQLPSKLSIGSVELRTPAEQIEFQECEAIVRKGWVHFAEVGEALLRIRDKELYKNEYHSFKAYCQERWGFGHSKVWGHISAAQVQNNLASIPGIPMPECEAQVRPLISLTPDLAQQAWVRALGWSSDDYVPARLVKRAVKQLTRSEQPAVVAGQKADKQQRYRRRKAVQTGFEELLTLLFQSAERDVLIAKVQEIQRLLEPILTPEKTRG
jgi:hypothetical protein